jgi:protein TonB
MFITPAQAAKPVVEQQPVPRPVTTRPPKLRKAAPAPEPRPSPSPAPNEVVTAPLPAAVPDIVPASPEPVPAAAAPTARPAPAVVQPGYSADYLRNPAPRYPPLARRMGQQGKVVLRVLVNSGGSPDRVELRTSSGSELLDEAARDAVRQWSFVPARRGDTPVDAWVLVPVTFTLRG